MKKTSRINLIMVIIIITFYACNQVKHSNTSLIDTIKAKNSSTPLVDTSCDLQKIAVVNFKIFAKVNDIDNTFLFKNEVYLLSSQAKKVFTIDLTTNKVAEQHQISHIIDSLYSDLSTPDKFYADTAGIVIAFDKGLVKLDNHFNIKYIIKNVNELYKNFQVLPTGEIAFFFNDAVSIYDKTGRFVKKHKLDSASDNFIKSNDHGIYCNDNSIYSLNISDDTAFAKKEIRLRKIDNYDLLQNEYPAYVTSKCILFFPSGKRDMLIVTDKDGSKVIKTISLSAYDFSTSNEDQMNLNEYYFDFSIELQGADFYIIHFNNHKLSVYKGCLGILQ